MKKFFVLAATALALLACVQPEELPVVDPEVNGDGAVAFSVYTSRAGATRAGTPEDVTNANIGNLGFGVFAYYTAGEKYDANAKPNFMYNQKIYKALKVDSIKPGQVAAGDSVWTYEPVKYWPNEYGNAAISDEVDYVTFFSYAPWTEFEPTTGDVTGDKTKNIISVNKNNATGDPIIKYVVDTDPATSVDLLWGVAASTAAADYQAIDKEGKNKDVAVEPGMPFLNLVKPHDPKSDKISFNLKHSLAKVKVTIDYIADDVTPDGTSKLIDSAATRIFVRSFKISGWATKGALNLNNTTPGQPLWKDFDGVKDLAFDDMTFFDGRKDGKEGDVNGNQNNETPQGLNPLIIENFAQVSATDGFAKTGKNWGVKDEPQLLFGGDSTKNGGYFYVIPRNETGSPVDVTIVYDVETIDPALAGLLSDGTTHGISVENVITKEAILGTGTDFEPGKQYLIKIHLGMTSVKIDAVVSDWIVTNDKEVNLPDNQDTPYWTVNELPGMIFSADPTVDGVPATWEAIYSEATWNDSFHNGVLKDYYAWCDDQELSEDYYNPATGVHGNNSGNPSPGTTAATWASQGFIHCWTGAILAPGAKYPWCAISLNDYLLSGHFYGNIGVSCNGADEIFPWTNNGAGGGPKTDYLDRERKFAIASIPNDFHYGTAMDQKVNATFPNDIDLSKIVVKFYLNPAKYTVKKHQNPNSI